jgi:hypothetical protein
LNKIFGVLCLGSLGDSGLAILLTGVFLERTPPMKANQVSPEKKATEFIDKVLSLVAMNGNNLVVGEIRDIAEHLMKRLIVPVDAVKLASRILKEETGFSVL